MFSPLRLPALALVRDKLSLDFLLCHYLLLSVLSDWRSSLSRWPRLTDTSPWLGHRYWVRRHGDTAPVLPVWDFFLRLTWSACPLVQRNLWLI